MLDIIDHGGIRELRLARPTVNALNIDMLRRLQSAVEDHAGVDAFVVTGQPNVFSAGLDVPAILASGREAAAELFTQLWYLQRALAASPVPVVFGITGHCPAGGTVLAIYADYRVMAEGDFRLGLNEVQVGLYPGPVIHGAYRRLVGGHAAQLLTRGALVDPATALRMGLVDELCAPAKCVERAIEVAREFASLPREAMRRTREMTRAELVALFGDPAQADALAREFGETGAKFWFVPETLERLATIFKRK